MSYRVDLVLEYETHIVSRRTGAHPNASMALEAGADYLIETAGWSEVTPRAVTLTVVEMPEVIV